MSTATTPYARHLARRRAATRAVASKTHKIAKSAPRPPLRTPDEDSQDADVVDLPTGFRRIQHFRQRETAKPQPLAVTATVLQLTRGRACIGELADVFGWQAGDQLALATHGWRLTISESDAEVVGDQPTVQQLDDRRRLLIPKARRERLGIDAGSSVLAFAFEDHNYVEVADPRRVAAAVPMTATDTRFAAEPATGMENR